MTTQLPGFWNSRRMDASLVFFFSLFLDPDLRLTRRIQDFWIWMSKWDQESCKFLPRHHENRLSFPPGGCIYWIIHGTYQILTTEAKRSPVETSPHGSSHILHQTIFDNLAMEMSIGCPWACGFFPLVVPSKADPAIAIVAIEGCLAIVTGFLIRPCDIVYAVGNLKHVPHLLLPTSAGQEKGWKKPRSFWGHWRHGFHAQKSGSKLWLCLKHLETSSSPSVGRLQKANSGTCSCLTLSQHHWASYLTSLIGFSLWLLENDSTQMGNDLT